MVTILTVGDGRNCDMYFWLQDKDSMKSFLKIKALESMSEMVEFYWYLFTRDIGPILFRFLVFEKSIKT